uniref:Uncharacterized protein n=1 Tax=Mycena chlorophos TaxID=658473 RepID=A0ABQ0L9E8_MYCCL|nr:predicted protein [Mycena chlorophos]
MQPSIAPHCLWFINPRDFSNVHSLPCRLTAPNPSFPAPASKPLLLFSKNRRVNPRCVLLQDVQDASDPCSQTATVQQAALSSFGGLASLGGAGVPTTGTTPDVAVSRVAENVARVESPAEVAGNIPAFGHPELECFVVPEEVESVQEVEIVEELQIAELEVVEEIVAEPAYGQIEQLLCSPSFPAVAVTTVDSVLAELKEADVGAQPMCTLMQMLEEFETDAPVMIASENQVPEISSEDEAIKTDEDFTLISPVASHEGEPDAVVCLTNDLSRVETTAFPTIDERVESDTPALDNPYIASSVAPEANQANSPVIPNVDLTATFNNIAVIQLADPGLVIAELHGRIAALEHDKAALIARVGTLEARNDTLEARANSFEARIAALETADHHVTHQPAAPPGAPLPPAAPLPPPLPNILLTGSPAAITDAALQSATARLVKVDKGNDTPSPSRGLLVTVEALKGVKLKRVPQPDAASKTTGATTGPSPCGSSKTAPITKEAAAVGPARYLGELISKLPPRVPSEASRKDLARKAESAAISDTASSQQQPSQSVRLDHQHLSDCELRTSASADSLPTAPSFVSMTASVLSNLFRLRRSRSREESTLGTRSSAQSLARNQSGISTTNISRPRSREVPKSVDATTMTTTKSCLRKAFSPITNLVASGSRTLPVSRSRNLKPSQVGTTGLWGGTVKRGKKSTNVSVAKEADKE